MPSGMASHETLLVLNTWAKFHKGSSWPLCSEEVEELTVKSKATTHPPHLSGAADRSPRVWFYLCFNWLRGGKQMSIRPFSWRKNKNKNRGARHAYRTLDLLESFQTRDHWTIRTVQRKKKMHIWSLLYYYFLLHPCSPCCCAVTTCVLQEVCKVHICNTSNVKHRDL